MWGIGNWTNQLQKKFFIFLLMSFQISFVHLLKLSFSNQKRKQKLSWPLLFFEVILLMSEKERERESRNKKRNGKLCCFVHYIILLHSARKSFIFLRFLHYTFFVQRILQNVEFKEKKNEF